MVRLKGTGRHAVDGFSASLLRDHVDWLLGHEVYGLAIKVGPATTRLPTWPLLLDFEWEVRCEVAQLMTRRRLSLAGALLVARQDDSLLRRHFLSPLGVDAAEQVLKSNAEAEVAKRFAQFEQSMRSLVGQKRGPDHASFPAGPDTKKLKEKGNRKVMAKESHPQRPLLQMVADL